MSDKIEFIRLCGVLRSNFLCLSQSNLRTQPCHVRMKKIFYVLSSVHTMILCTQDLLMLTK